MMYKEFTERTGFYPDTNMYAAIEDAYNEFKGDKNEFCKAYKANQDGLAEKIARDASNRARLAMDKKDEEICAAQYDLQQAGGRIEWLKKRIEQEEEWKPYTVKDQVSDDDYINGKAAAFQEFEGDDDAKEWIAAEFGFAMRKIEILHSRYEFEVNRHGQLRKTGEVNRDPWYNATDWYYVRFQVCGISYEAYNGSLSKV